MGKRSNVGGPRAQSRGGAQQSFSGSVGKALRSAKLPATWGAL